MLPRIDGLNYLASPFSHPEPWVMQDRYKEVLRAHVKLLMDGHIVFCPIVHTYYPSKMMGKVVDHDFWINQDIPILRASKRLIVLMLDGWKFSKGVASEVSVAVKEKIEVVYADQEEI